MQIFDNLVLQLVPELQIEDEAWRDKWKQEQKEQFRRLARFYFSIVAVGYPLNFLLFDLPMKLEPIEFWLTFRVSITAMALAATFFYFSRLSQTDYYQLPAIFSNLILCVSQAAVADWFMLDAWIFFYIFVLTTVIVMNLNTLVTIFYLITAFSFGSPILLDAGLSIEYLVSSTLVTFGICVVVRRSGVTDVRNFLLNQENIANQEKLAQLSSEFSDRVRSFIPRVISERMTSLVEQQSLSVMEASIRALAVREQSIACLFTDIRGFTQGSKDLGEFIEQSVLPEVTACSNAIEANRGIPRKIGDLIFAYFDHELLELNVLRAVASGMEVARLNEQMNATQSAIEIRRYILISSGDALVGNFGSLDSAVEITALGDPVNFLSRLDDATKTAALSEKLESGDLVLSMETSDILNHAAPDIELESIPLNDLGIVIRDFPEVSEIVLLRPTASNYEKVFLALAKYASNA